MKKGFIGSLIGVAIVVAADTIIRVIVSISLNIPVDLFLYENYGFTWSLLICALTLVTSFLGGFFSVTYADIKKRPALIMYGVWLMALRYGQIHYAMDVELLLPIVALVFSLLAVVLVWRFFLSKKKTTPIAEPSGPVADTEPHSQHKKHHSPNANE
ncbi:hypothetical protein [Rhodohalobacter sp. 8-1]|uniref:hypothetical protein n=1 Tax=Rhodohalobacter sp. 8-1 TaxID=3131972 RepID=UPI0030EE1DCF